MTRVFVAPLLALALVMSACGSDSGGDEAAVDAVDSTEASPTTEPDAARQPDSGDAEADDPEADDAEADDPEADDAEAPAEEPERDEPDPWANPPGIWDQYRTSRHAEIRHWRGDIETAIGGTLPARLEPGEHRTEQLGTPITFTTTQAHVLIEENPGHVLILAEPGDSSRVLYLLRPVGVYGNERTLEPNASIAGRGWSDPVPEDLGEWLESLEHVRSTELERTSIGGRDVRAFDIAPGDSEGYFCTAGQCRNLFPSGAAIQNLVVLRDDQRAVMWEIEEEGTDLVVLAKGPIEGETGEAWFATVDSIIGSMTFGESRPFPSDSTLWDARGIIGPGTHRWAGVDWVTTNFEVEYDFVHLAGYLSFAAVRPDGSPVGTPEDGEIFVTLGQAETSLDGAIFDTLQDFAAEAEVGFGVGSSQEIDPPQELVDRVGVVRSWRLEAPRESGREETPIFHHAAPSSDSVYPFGAYTTVGFDELHAFEREGAVWVLQFASSRVDRLEEAREFGLQLLAEMDFDGDETTTLDLASLESGDTLSEGTWRASQLANPVTVAVDGDRWVAAVVGEHISLIADREAFEREEPIRWFAILEPTGLASSDELIALPDDGVYSLAVSDFDQWVEAMTSDDGEGPRAAVTTAEATIGDEPATVVDVELIAGPTDTIEGGCGADRCYAFAGLGPDDLPLVVRPGEIYRFWFVTAPAGELVIASGTAAGDQAWFDSLDPIIESIAIG